MPNRLDKVIFLKKDITKDLFVPGDNFRLKLWYGLDKVTTLMESIVENMGEIRIGALGGLYLERLILMMLGLGQADDKREIVWMGSRKMGHSGFIRIVDPMIISHFFSVSK